MAPVARKEATDRVQGLVVKFKHVVTGQFVDDPVLSGDYEETSTIHGRPVFRKKRTPNDTSPEVHCYFWGERENSKKDSGKDDFCGWWFGRKVGGEAVWARNQQPSALPPEAGWHVVAGGDPKLELTVLPKAAEQLTRWTQSKHTRPSATTSVTTLVPTSAPTSVPASAPTAAPAARKSTQKSVPTSVPRSTTPPPINAKHPGHMAVNTIRAKAAADNRWPRKEEMVQECAVIDEKRAKGGRTLRVATTDASSSNEEPLRHRPPLPWREVKHLSSYYYWNELTGETTWEPPAGSLPVEMGGKTVKKAGVLRNISLASLKRRLAAVASGVSAEGRGAGRREERRAEKRAKRQAERQPRRHARVRGARVASGLSQSPVASPGRHKTGGSRRLPSQSALRRRWEELKNSSVAGPETETQLQRKLSPERVRGAKQSGLMALGPSSRRREPRDRPGALAHQDHRRPHSSSSARRHRARRHGDSAHERSQLCGKSPQPSGRFLRYSQPPSRKRMASPMTMRSRTQQHAESQLSILSPDLRSRSRRRRHHLPPLQRQACRSGSRGRRLDSSCRSRPRRRRKGQCGSGSGSPCPEVRAGRAPRLDLRGRSPSCKPQRVSASPVHSRTDIQLVPRSPERLALAAQLEGPPPPLTRLPPGRQMHCPGVVCSDEGLREWLASEGPRHLDMLGPGALDCVDFSHNSLTDEGADRLVDFLLGRSQPTRRLKLFHNRLREPRALCRLLEDPHCGVGAPDGIAELHLSHNLVRRTMVQQLLNSVGCRVAKLGGPLRPPLWLRLERNTELSDEAQSLAKEGGQFGVKLCLEASSRKSGCTLRRCRYGADVHLVFSVLTGK